MKKWILHFLALTTILSLLTIHIYFQSHSTSAIQKKGQQDADHGVKDIHPLLRERLFVAGIHANNGSDGTGMEDLGNVTFPNNLTLMYISKELAHHPVYYPGECLPTFRKDSVSNNLLPRRLDMKLEQRLFDLVIQFTSMLKSHGISFTMAHGMLLGSYLFHNMIPWDDDLDIYIDIKDINKLKAMFRSDHFRKTYRVHSYWEKDMYSDAMLKEEVPWSNTYSCGSGSKKEQKCYKQGKVYFKKAAKAGKQVWTYPFVDFTFFKNNRTHVFNHDNWKVEPKVILPVEEFYPLTLRPFDRFWLPAPKNTAQVLKYKFKQFQCKNGHWDHPHEMRYKGKVKTVDCNKLKVSYPYVRRRKYNSENGTEITNKVIEDLMLADIILYSVVIDISFKTADVLRLE